MAVCVGVRRRGRSGLGQPRFWKLTNQSVDRRSWREGCDSVSDSHCDSQYSVWYPLLLWDLGGFCEKR